MNAEHDPRPVPLRSRRDRFVRAVLDVSVMQLAERGFDRLSIPEIARLAGVNKTSIYRRWPDKIGLVRDALQAAIGDATSAPDTGALREDLLELARRVAAFLQSPVGMAVFRVLLAEGDNPHLRALAQTSYSTADQEGPALVIRRAIARGELGSGVNVQLVLFTLGGAVLHRVMLERQPVTEDYLNQVVHLVLHGACAATERASPSARSVPSASESGMDRA